MLEIFFFFFRGTTLIKWLQRLPGVSVGYLSKRRSWDITPHKATCCFKTFVFVSFNLACRWILLLQPFSRSLQTVVAGFSQLSDAAPFVQQTWDWYQTIIIFFSLWQAIPLKPLLLCLMTYKWMSCVFPSPNFASQTFSHSCLKSLLAPRYIFANISHSFSADPPKSSLSKSTAPTTIKISLWHFWTSCLQTGKTIPFKEGEHIPKYVCHFWYFSWWIYSETAFWPTTWIWHERRQRAADSAVSKVGQSSWHDHMNI